MTQYKLKSNQPDFEVVDGPMAGRKFQAGTIYTEVPDSEVKRFDKVPEAVESKPSPQPGLRLPPKTIQEARQSRADRNPQQKGEVKDDA